MLLTHADGSEAASHLLGLFGIVDVVGGSVAGAVAEQFGQVDQFGAGQNQQAGNNRQVHSHPHGYFNCIMAIDGEF